MQERRKVLVIMHHYRFRVSFKYNARFKVLSPARGRLIKQRASRTL